MPERKRSVDSFDEYFGVSSTTTNKDDQTSTKTSAILNRTLSIDEKQQKPLSKKLPSITPYSDDDNKENDGYHDNKTIIEKDHKRQELEKVTNSNNDQTVTKHHQGLDALITRAPTYSNKNISLNNKQSNNNLSTKIRSPPIVETKFKVNNNSKTQASNHDADSIRSAAYSSDFDNDEGDDDDDDRTIVTDRVKKHASLPPSKRNQNRIAGTLSKRHGSESELKSTTIIIKPNQNHNRIRRKENFLPSIRNSNKMTKMTNNNLKILRPHHLKRKHEQQQFSMPKGEVEPGLLSAQNTKMKILENKIAELKLALDTIRMENHTLKTIQRREEMAIKKYENQDYDIQRVIKDYTSETQYFKELLFNEKQLKLRLEKTVDSKNEKLRDTQQRLKYYEKIASENHLDERYAMKEKIQQTDRKYQELLGRLTTQEKHTENLERNHKYEINTLLLKQKELKHELNKRQTVYNEMMLKLENKTKQIDTMHIYTQRDGHRPDTDTSKSRSLQSLQQQTDTSPRFREKILDYDKKRRTEQEKKKTQQQHYEQQQQTKKLRTHLPRISTHKKQIKTQHKAHTDDEKKIKKDSIVQNSETSTFHHHKPRYFSSPESVAEQSSDDDEDSSIISYHKKKANNNQTNPTNMMQRSEPPISHSRNLTSVAEETKTTSNKYISTGVGNTLLVPPVFRLTEPPPFQSKTKVVKDLDEKWQDVFNTNDNKKQAKDDLLAKLVAATPTISLSKTIVNDDDKKTTKPSEHSVSRGYEFDSATTNLHEGRALNGTAVKKVDPLESLFGTNSKTSSITNQHTPDDIFASKTSVNTIKEQKTDLFDSLFAPPPPKSTKNTTTTTTSSVKNNSDKSTTNQLQRPKMVTDIKYPLKINNRATMEEVEEFIL
ncbi:unnamed protein product [Didymodactylos carnosus]|uniref:Lebercilin domain-containing protein n=1 Tax=Didymodactylos carnosus TaxID=1234261 RepID=A0A8S2DE22_9BILA|nr:unnamed protein product [Didymodactylos carnosus]CAF3719588.1 unnamed protein product [Didymodactylos carnosus]